MTKTEYPMSKKPAVSLSNPMTAFVFAAIVLLLAAAAVSFFLFDNYVFDRLYNAGIKWTGSRPFKIFQYLGKTELLVWLVLFGAILTGKSRLLVIAIFTFLAVGVIVQSVKLISHRERPRDVIKRVYEKKAEAEPQALLRSWSFPSGDTANVFAIATVLLAFVRRRWAFFFFAISCCIGLLRVLVLAHYPSDCFGGAAAGIFAGFAVLKIFSQRSLPAWVDSKQFYSIQIIAFILIPVFLAVTKFRTFVDIVGAYGVLLALIYITFLLRQKYRIRN
jgi:membrane-associated phospholipid phosphatase